MCRYIHEKRFGKKEKKEIIEDNKLLKEIKSRHDEKTKSRDKMQSGSWMEENSEWRGIFIQRRRKREDSSLTEDKEKEHEDCSKRPSNAHLNTSNFKTKKVIYIYIMVVVVKKKKFKRILIVLWNIFTFNQTSVEQKIWINGWSLNYIIRTL